MQEEPAGGGGLGSDLPLTDIKSTGMTAEELQRRLQLAELEEQVELYAAFSSSWIQTPASLATHETVRS